VWVVGSGWNVVGGMLWVVGCGLWVVRFCALARCAIPSAPVSSRAPLCHPERSRGILSVTHETTEDIPLASPVMQVIAFKPRSGAFLSPTRLRGVKIPTPLSSRGAASYPHLTIGRRSAGCVSYRIPTPGSRLGLRKTPQPGLNAKHRSRRNSALVRAFPHTQGVALGWYVAPRWG
jgi:hypothetical protein